MNSSTALGIFAITLHIAAASAETVCDPSNPAFVCGASNTEDLVRLPGTPWVVANQIGGRFVEPQKAGSEPVKFDAYEARRRHIPGFGPLQVVNINTRAVRRLYPTPESTVDWDRKTYPDCAAPPETPSFGGLNVRPSGREKFRLYAANHGGRSSVEIIDLAIQGERLLTAWRGCIRTPDWIFPNSVVPLPNDGVALSGLGVGIWRPGRGWTKVDLQSELTNGVEVSRDGQWLLVVDTGGSSVVRVPLKGGAEPAVIKLDFVPDNLRRGDDDRLYVAGPDSREALEKCSNDPNCVLGFAVAQIDPEALTAKVVLRSKGIDGLRRGATVALRVADSFWIGSGRADRVAILRVEP